MTEEPDHRIDELERQMEAANSLIESLEEEVEGLRQALEEASLALRMARQEVSAREHALEERDLARAQAEQKARELSETVTGLQSRNSDEQLQLRNQHIAELSKMQDRFGAQRIAELGRSFSGEDAAALKDEYRRDLQDVERRHRQEIEALESSFEEWRSDLLESERGLKEQHAAEIQSLRHDAESQKKELQRTLREDYEQRLGETRRSLESRHEEETQALTESAEKRVSELESTHQASLAALREQTERGLQEAEERRRREIREIKTIAENRERGLRQGQASKAKEAEEESGRRLAALQAQRKADNEALKARYENELTRLRKESEESLAAEMDRIKELEQTNSEQEDPKPAVEEKALDVEGRRRLAELERELESSQAVMEQLTAELERWRSRDAGQNVSGPGDPGPEAEETVAAGGSADTTEFSALERDAYAAKDDTRVRELETRLRDAQEDRRQYADELGEALDKLRRLSDPEHRLRAGVAAFNESNHSRHVGSISKALGLPGVHAGIEG
ncbi:MAG: hypothetical protein WA990_06070, partial [Rubrobacteraceae bacterium]